jgi:hypothetical protein
MTHFTTQHRFKTCTPCSPDQLYRMDPSLAISCVVQRHVNLPFGHDMSVQTSGWRIEKYHRRRKIHSCGTTSWTFQCRADVLSLIRRIIRVHHLSAQSARDLNGILQRQSGPRKVTWAMARIEPQGLHIDLPRFVNR